MILKGFLILSKRTRHQNFVSEASRRGPERDGRSLPIISYYPQSAQTVEFLIDGGTLTARSSFVLKRSPPTTAAQIAEMASLSQTEMIALAYVEAVGGDVNQALSDAIDDLLALEARFAETQHLVSYGFVRGGISPEPR